MEEIPFPNLKIDLTDFLDNLAGRSKCPKCRKSRKYYCYTCYIPVKEIEDRVPKIKLPIKVDIIKHPSECDGKSTAVHAGVICPDDVTILTYPCIPDYSKEKTLLVFPGDKSVTLEELAEQLSISRDLTESPVSNNKHNQKTAPRTQNYGLADKDEKLDGSLNSEIDRARVNESAEFETRKLDNETNKMAIGVVNEDAKLETKLLANETNKTTVAIGQESVENSEPSRSKEQEIAKELRNSETEKLNDAKMVLEKMEVASKLEDSVSPFDRVVFIDSTWNQTRSICNDERLKGVRCVELKTRKTKFWRHQDDVPDTYLSTVEAIYYFMRDFHETFMKIDYNGEYDNLLFFFTFMYQKIRTLYDGGEELRAYKKRKVTPN